MVNYECVRCHYNSKDKQIMRKHLFGRKQCEGIYSKLDLTDEIRDNILTYGTFQKDNMLKNIIKVEDGYIYIAHTRACIDSNKEIFKAGKTKIPENRIKGYTKGTVYKLIVKVKDYHNAEKIILKICREQLIQRRDYGCEYFEGNLISIRDIIISNCDIIEKIYDDCKKNKTIPYTCIRCDYTTKIKSHMRDHLFKKLKPCPGTKHDIELTPEIKDKILLNRIYHIPKEDEPTVEEKYLKEIKKLKNDKYRWGMHLNQDQLLEIVDNISRASDNFEDFNVLYDSEQKKVKLYSRSWSPYLVDTGVKKLVETIQDSYLYAYEMYLIKKIYGGKITNYPELTKYKNSLEEYYKFISIFDIQPYCIEKTDDTIIENGKDTYEIEEKILKIYNNVNIKTPKGDINKIKKTVLDIIKSNSKTNVKELNKKLIDLLKMNEEFKNDLLKNLGLYDETIKIEPLELTNEIIEDI